MNDSRRFGRLDDGDVRRASRFLRTVRRSGGDAHHPRVRHADPALREAYLLHRAGADRRWEVEACLLARQDDAAIAETVGVASDVIAAYGAIWFDVRSRLAAPDCMMAIALGGWRDESAAPLDVETLWKTCGYHLGPFVLDRLVAWHRRERSTGESTHHSGDAVDLTALLMNVMRLPADARSGPAILQLAAESDRLERRAAARAVAPVFAPLVGRRLNRDVLGRWSSQDWQGALDAGGSQAGRGTSIPGDHDGVQDLLPPLEPLHCRDRSAAGLTGRRAVG